MNLRPMQMSDADFMLEMKNYPETRKYAIVSHEEIKREDHIKWLSKNIDQFHVLEKWSGEKVAAVRVSKDLEVSVWVKREYWEFGIATKLVSGYYSSAPMYGVWAKIVDGNISSFRAFIRAGFKPTEHIDNYYILRK